jgi:hypothetical protein
MEKIENRRKIEKKCAFTYSNFSFHNKGIIYIEILINVNHCFTYQLSIIHNVYLWSDKLCL